MLPQKTCSVSPHSLFIQQLLLKAKIVFQCLGCIPGVSDTAVNQTVLPLTELISWWGEMTVNKNSDFNVTADTAFCKCSEEKQSSLWSSRVIGLLYSVEISRWIVQGDEI